MISRDDADRALAELGAAYDRIATAIYAVDVHPALGLLRGQLFVGATQSRARALGPVVDLLWAHFALLGELLGQARAVRGRRRLDDSGWAELARLLRGPVAILGADGMPVDNGGAGGVGLGGVGVGGVGLGGVGVGGVGLGGVGVGGVGVGGVGGGGASGNAVRQLSLGELAQQLENRCADTLSQLSEVESSRVAVVTRVAPVVELVSTVVALAEQLGEARDAEVLRRSVDEAQRLDLDDPLTAAPGGRLTGPVEARWAALDSAARDTRRQLDELVNVRDDYPRRRTSLVVLVDAVEAAEQAVAQTYQTVAEKIADAGPAPALAAAAVLRARVAELDRLREQARWRGLAANVAIIEDAAVRARAHADDVRLAAEGLLARRGELRGRLDAYRAKTARRGLAEDEGLSTLYRQAHDLLFTAPCDLRAATRAVYAYQRRLADVLGADVVGSGVVGSDVVGSDAVGSDVVGSNAVGVGERSDGDE